MVASYARVVTTCANAVEAQSLIAGAMQTRLAACAQTTPIESTYWWQEKLETAQEISISFKTREDLIEPIMHYLRQHHSYATPQILVYPITGGDIDYLNWIRTETMVVKQK